MKFNKFDLRWMLSLFGTAVGAGILFLPIRAGTGGFWPIVVMCVIIFPMTYLGHRALCRFVSSSQNPGSDITSVVGEYFGEKWGLAINFLYWFAFYPVCLAYGVGLTNTVESFLVNQLGMTDINRLLIATILCVFLMGVMVFSEEFITKFCEVLVMPLCALLLAFSLYLIPHWDGEILRVVPSAKEFFSVIILTLPILAFAFEHTPAISTFTLSIQREYGASLKDKKCDQILFYNAVILLFFVMFFLFSCTLCLNQNDFILAREQNIPIVSYFANKLENPFVAYVAPIVAFLAITTSFFGHYFGAREGMNALLKRAALVYKTSTPDPIKVTKITDLFVFFTMIFAAWLNPSILGFLESVGGPVIAAILFILPMIGVYKVKSMAKYKDKLADAFIIITGLTTILSTVYKMAVD